MIYRDLRSYHKNDMPQFNRCGAYIGNQIGLVRAFDNDAITRSIDRVGAIIGVAPIDHLAWIPNPEKPGIEMRAYLAMVIKP